MQQVEQRFLLGLWAQGTRLTDTVPCGRDARQASGPQRREEAGDTRGVGGQAWRTFTGGGPGAWGLPVPTVLCGGPALHGTQDTRVHNTHMCTTHASALHLHIHHTRTTHVCAHTGAAFALRPVPQASPSLALAAAAWGTADPGAGH